MGIDPIDASNASIPPTHPLTHQSLPLPTTVRGEPLLLTGNGGRHNDNNDDRAPLLLYARDKLLIVREIHLPSASSNKSTHRPSSVYKSPHGAPSTSGFVYRSHSSAVTAASFSPSGTYVASADARGKLRVWSYDHPEHLSKLDVVGLSSAIRDVAWDSEGKRIVYAGDGGTKGDGVSAKAIQWDTAVRCGTLTNHGRKRAMSCDVRPTRPIRVVTGGGEDAAIYLHGGPPFERRIGDEVAERCHERGSVNRLRYNKDGSVLVSAGTDGAVIFYEGKEMRLLTMKKKVHEGSVFGCVWNRTGEYVLTCGADGFAKLLDGRVGNDLGSVVYEWNLIEILSAGRRTGDRVPVGAMQLGCAFVKGDVPVSVGYNGQIAVLPLPSSLNLSFVSAAAGLKEPIVITGHQAPISAMTFGAPGTNTIYTADTDGVIIEWDGSTGVAKGRVSSVNDDDDVDLTGKVHSGAITSLTFEGNTLYSCGWDDCIRHTRERLCTDHPLKIESQPNAMTRGGSLVVVMTVDGLLFLRDRLPVSELIRLPFTATAVCLSRDDSILYVGGDDCNIYVYSVSFSGGNTGNPTTESHVIRGGHLKPVQSLMLSHGGTMLAAADVRDVCVYSAEDYSTVVSKGRWCFHTQRIGCLAWSPDDTVLASGGNDDDIFLWCVAKKTKRIHYRFAHRGGVTGLRFVGDAVVGGEGDWMLVSAGHDGCLNWWNVEEDVKSKFK